MLAPQSLTDTPIASPATDERRRLGRFGMRDGTRPSPSEDEEAISVGFAVQQTDVPSKKYWIRVAAFVTKHLKAVANVNRCFQIITRSIHV